MFLFLEPSILCSPHAGVSRFCSLVAIFYDLAHPTFANLWQSCHIPALLSISFSVFLFLSHQLLSVVLLLDPFLYPFSPHTPTITTFALSRNSSNLSTPVTSRIFSLFILSLKVFPHIILVSVVFSFLSFSTFNAQYSAPWVKALLTELLYKVPLTFNDMHFPHVAFKTSLNFLQPTELLLPHWVHRRGQRTYSLLLGCLHPNLSFYLKLEVTHQGCIFCKKNLSLWLNFHELRNTSVHRT